LVGRGVEVWEEVSKDEVIFLALSDSPKVKYIFPAQLVFI
jgi:hypothetical protein